MNLYTIVMGSKRRKKSRRRTLRRPVTGAVLTVVLLTVLFFEYPALMGALRVVWYAAHPK